MSTRRWRVTLAQGCASTAWVFSILSSDNMAVLAYPEQVTAGSVGRQQLPPPLAATPNLNAKAKASASRGYRLTGSWGFCSGPTSPNG